MKNIDSIIDSAEVISNYDGFRICVEVKSNFSIIECACYFYSSGTVVHKSGYKKGKHIYFFNKDNATNLKVKIFFRYIDQPLVKKSKVFSVSNKNKLNYSFSNKILSKIDFNNYEILGNKLQTVENYEESGFRPRKDVIPYKLSIPIKWLENPYKDSNWMFQLHAWRMLDCYLIRGKINDFNQVAEIINDWVNFEKTNNKLEDKWLWYDMSTGLRALKISYYIKICFEKNIDHKIEDIDYLINKHLEYLSDVNELNHGNHGLFQLNGLKSLIYILQNYDSESFNLKTLNSYSVEKMNKLITSQLGSYGVHTENSPAYHFFTHKKILNIINSPWWSDISKDTLDILELGERVKPWLVFPNNKCVPIGDSETGKEFKNLRSLNEWPHIKHENYIGSQVDGYSVVRSNTSIPNESSSFLFFQASFYSQVHKHRDDLSFILQENGVDILIDSGKYGYKPGKYRQYFLSTRAHNTIEVDNTNTSRVNKNAYGSAVVHVPKYLKGFWILRGKVNQSINKYSHERVILYKPGKEVYVIDKIINNDNSTKRDINQWWHFDSCSKLSVEDKKATLKINNDMNIIITSETSGGGPVKFTSFRGYDSGKSLIGWVSKSYLQYEPTSTLRLSSVLNNTLTILTKFEINNTVAAENTISLQGDIINTIDEDLYKYLNSGYL
ncbi:heparinase II/III domain-containing protein [Psychrobacter sp. 2Y5]|uniref:heparinase II/III domain-containing protein n=1 Tax=unclassified Psychrobacter TaxID=196806 RepID=UPI003F47CD9C